MKQITVGELIEKLSKFPPDLPVMLDDYMTRNCACGDAELWPFPDDVQAVMLINADAPKNDVKI